MRRCHFPHAIHHDALCSTSGPRSRRGCRCSSSPGGSRRRPARPSPAAWRSPAGPGGSRRTAARPAGRRSSPPGAPAAWRPRPSRRLCRARRTASRSGPTGRGPRRRGPPGESTRHPKGLEIREYMNNIYIYVCIIWITFMYLSISRSSI